jgi:hypothetical protein
MSDDSKKPPTPEKPPFSRRAPRVSNLIPPSNPSGLSEKTKAPFAPPPSPPPNNDNEKKAEKDELHDTYFLLARLVLAKDCAAAAGVLEHVSGVDAAGIDAAQVLIRNRNNKKSTLSDTAFANMLTANFLARAENGPEIENLFDKSVVRIVHAFRKLARDDAPDERVQKLRTCPKETKAISLADTIAELELLATHSRSDRDFNPPPAAIKFYAEFLQKTCAVDGMEDGLVDMAVTAFNDLSRAVRHPLVLIRNNDGAVRLRVKNDAATTPPPKPT